MTGLSSGASKSLGAICDAGRDSAWRPRRGEAHDGPSNRRYTDGVRVSDPR